MTGAARAAATVLLLLVALVACAADQSAGGDPATATGTGENPAAATGTDDPTGEDPAAATGTDDPTGEDPAATTATDELRIGLTEWSIETAGAMLVPGQVRVVVTNAGATGHDVVIHGARGTWRTPVLRAGERHEMVITTTQGERLELVCTVAGHDTAGMRTQVAVAGTGAR